MCYYVSFHQNLQTLIDFIPGLIIDVQPHMDFTPTPYINGFDHRPHPIMLQSEKDNSKRLSLMMWGMVPNYIRNLEEARRFWNGYKDADGKWHNGYLTLNAKGEELLSKKLYSDAALHRRCIVFSDGFYEWHHHFPMGKKGQLLKTAVTYPHHIFLKENNSPIMMAGIWSPWKHEEVDPDTGEIIKLTTPCFSILTTDANELMAKVHNTKKRMPVILTRELAKEWINPNLSSERVTEIAKFQYAAASMKAFSIPKDFQQLSNPKEMKAYPELEGLLC